MTQQSETVIMCPRCVGIGKESNGKFVVTNTDVFTKKPPDDCMLCGGSGRVIVRRLDNVQSARR